MHLSFDVLTTGLDPIRTSPVDAGRLELIVRRPAEDQREVLEEVELDPEGGVVGDTWRIRSGDSERQVTVMNARAVALLAGSRDRWALAGDQLYVDFDISVANLPPGTRIEIGTAVLEISSVPHRGCKKFAARYGVDALRFVNSEEGSALRLRGLNARVVHGGLVRIGDPIRKLAP
jgi:MOSC domain-containing protein YiiM